MGLPYTPIFAGTHLRELHLPVAIASMTKAITTTAILQLVERAFVRLDSAAAF